MRTATAPTCWTIADPEGNEVDITFSVGREELFRTDVSSWSVAPPGPTDSKNAH